MRLALFGPAYSDEISPREFFINNCWIASGGLPGVESGGAVSILPLAGVSVGANHNWKL